MGDYQKVIDMFEWYRIILKFNNEIKEQDQNKINKSEVKTWKVNSRNVTCMTNSYKLVQKR